jgi:uncharacterized membrane protein YeaQ/YmgE (transglycosylase-associated protein family)
MSLLAIIIIGGIIGWLAARLAGRDEGIIGSIVIGIVGAFIGSALASVLNAGAQSYFAFSWSGVLWSFIGAVILSAILNAVQHHPSGVPR